MIGSVVKSLPLVAHKLVPTYLVRQVLAIFTVVLLTSCTEETLQSEYSNDQCDPEVAEAVTFSINYTVYEGDSNTSVTDVATLSSAITFENSRQISTNIPSPSTTTGGTLSLPTSLTITDNSSSYIQITPTGIPTGYHISAVMVQFQGNAEHFLIPIDPDAAEDAAVIAALKAEQLLISDEEAAAVRAFADAGGVVIKLSGPISGDSDTSLINGTNPGDLIVTSTMEVAAFLVQDSATDPDYSQNTWEGIDVDSNWTSTATLTAEAKYVGTGAFQITLTWDTGILAGEPTESGAVDLDLYLTEPSNDTIYYGNRLVDSSGQLDVDNQIGFGPENIFYDTDPADGNYKIEVIYYDWPAADLIPTSWTIAVTACNSSQSYTGYAVTKSVTRLVVEFELGTNCTLPDPEDFEPEIEVYVPPSPNTWEQSELCSASLNDQVL